MKQLFKRVLSLLLVVCLLCTAIPSALAAEGDQLLLLLHRKGPALARALQLNDAALRGHHTVQVDHRAAVLLIAEVKHRHIVHDPRRDGGHKGRHRQLFELSGRDELAQRNHQRDKPARDRRRPRPAVALQHVAVHHDGDALHR